MGPFATGSGLKLLMGETHRERWTQACQALGDDTGKEAPAFGVLGPWMKEIPERVLSRQNLALLDLGWFR
jgi:hypothetical protein